MAESYDIHLTDPLSAAFTVRAFTSNGTIFPTSGNLNVTAVGAETSLLVYGKGHPEYGERTSENILHILENFSGSTEPQNPVSGQLWYERFTAVRTGVSDFTIWTDGAGWGTTFGLIAAILPAIGSVVDGDYALDLSDDLFLAVNDPSHPLSPTWLLREYEALTSLPATPRKTLKVYNGTSWEEVNSVRVSAEAPTTPLTGDLWYDSDIPQLNVYDGSDFVSVAERYLLLDGTVAMTGDFNMGGGSPAGNRITNLADPVDPQDAATRSWTESLTGAVPTTLAGLSDTDINDTVAIASGHHISWNGSNWINGVLVLTDFGINTTAANINTAFDGTVAASNFQDQIDGRLQLIGGAISGNLVFTGSSKVIDMGSGLNNKITNLTDPTPSSQDAATAAWVEAQLTSTSLALEDLTDVTYTGGSPAVVPISGQVLEFDGFNWTNGNNSHTHPSSSITHETTQPYFRDAFPVDYPNLILSTSFEHIVSDFSTRLDRNDAFNAREVFIAVGGSPGQTDFEFTDGKYTVAANNLSVFVNGIKQYADERARQHIQFDFSKNLSVQSLLGLPAHPVGSPALQNEYQLDVAANGNPAVTISLILDNTSTIQTLLTQLTAQLISGSPAIPFADALWSSKDTNITIFSRSTGNGSSINITEGATNGILTALTNVALGSPADPELPVLAYGGSPDTIIVPAFSTNVTQITSDFSYKETDDNFSTSFAGLQSSSIQFNSPLAAGAVVEMISTGV